MREIKFRAFDTRTKKMSPDFVLFTEFTLYAWQRNEDACTGIRLSDLHVMQFTGLLDKNGMEIYEGDIIGFTGMMGSVSDKEHGFFEIVEFDGGGFSPFAIPGWEVTPEPDKIEVFGNIYENPDLIAPKVYSVAVNGEVVSTLKVEYNHINPQGMAAELREVKTVLSGRSIQRVELDKEKLFINLSVSNL